MFIHRLTLKNLLSFKDATIELGPLNVLIGPNAVGKSNLIEAIGLLQATRSGFMEAILRGGGIIEMHRLGPPRRVAWHRDVDRFRVLQCR